MVTSDPTWTGMAAPRMRGDDPLSAGPGDERQRLLPACAGMIPHPLGKDLRSCPAPRMRGDDPNGTIDADAIEACSPHARG